MSSIIEQDIFFDSDNDDDNEEERKEDFDFTSSNR